MEGPVKKTAYPESGNPLDNSSFIAIVRKSTGFRLFVLFVLFFFFLLISGGGAQALSKLPGLSEKNSLYISAFLQDILAFCIPALLTALYASRSPLKFTGISVRPRLRQFIGVIAVVFFSMPAMNWIIEWNASIHFPTWASSLEAVLRKWEETGAAMTSTMMTGMTIVEFITAICIIGLITGFSEELFFRGALQKIFSESGIKTWIAVWMTAFIFSFMHFQFFGFIPRLLMGVFFGYLFAWSGSLWPAAFAHALNNSMVVIAEWIHINRIPPEVAYNENATSSGNGILVISSFVMTILFFIFFRGIFKTSAGFRPQDYQNKLQ